MFCPRPFVDEGCQVPAAPAAEPSTVPGQIFSREKQLSHSSLRSVPTSPAARDAREFTGDRRSHTGSWQGLLCLSANLSKPAESISLAQDLSAACPPGRAGETAGGQGPDLPFNQAELLGDAPAARGGNASSRWDLIPLENGVLGLGVGSCPSSGAGAGQRWLRAGKGQRRSPRRSDEVLAGHWQPLCHHPSCSQ